jgi:caffeoyl-CoA O-methyltransferase
MSASSDALDPGIARYIAGHARGDDELLIALKRDAAASGIPAIWIAPEQAAFQAILLRAAGARRVLEIGTLAGYAAIAMARALPTDGALVTLELDPARAEFARRWIARSDVAARVEVRTGRASDLLPAIPDASFDAAFLDADKVSYPLYLRESLRIVRTGGLVLVDNAFAFGELLSEHPRDRETPAVRAFNELMAREERLESIIVPFGDGLWVGVKRT